MSRVSILLPTYNGERYVEYCIESVMQQEDPRWRLLIRDDGSDDRTEEIIHSFNDDRIEVLSDSRRLGLFGNLNSLVREASSPLVRFLCQDDRLELGCIGNEIEFFKARPEIVMAYCKFKNIDGNGEVVDEVPAHDVASVINKPRSLMMLYYWGCLPGNLSTVCVRGPCIEAVGGFNESYHVSGDYDLWARLCRLGALGVIHQHLVHVRCHPDQLSREESSQPAFVKEDRRVRREELMPYLPEGAQSSARWHELCRQNVTDTHRVIRSVLTGNWRNATRILKTQGWFDALLGLILWALTLNNNLYKPSPDLTVN